VEFRGRPGGHDGCSGDHLSGSPGCREAVGQGEAGAAVAEAAQELSLGHLRHAPRLPRH